jgi:hypothetical protein
MVFKKLSKIVALSLAILVACAAQANKSFDLPVAAGQVGSLSYHTIVTACSLLVGIGSLHTLYSIKKSPQELHNPDDLATTKWLSYAGLICALNGLYTATTGIWPAKPTHTNYDSLSALSSIQSALEKNK